MPGTIARFLKGSRPSSRLLFESALILFSVLLGFAVTEWRESARERELASRVLANVLAEVQENLATVDSQIQKHQKMVESLKAIDVSASGGSGWDTAIAAMGGGPDAVPMRQAAWQAAVSSGALRLMDYDVAAALSDIYTIQIDVYAHNVAQSASSVFIPESFRPESRDETLQLFLWSMINLEGQERFLKTVYERNLPTLREHVEGAPAATDPGH
jgi:hypothetical protein